MRSLRFFEKKDITKKFGVISPLKQIINEVKFISISNNEEKYHNVIFEMKKHLNYKEVESLVHLSQNFSNWDTFMSRLENEKYFWKKEIEFEFHKDLENAKISLCTSDFLAFIIGKKYGLHQLINENSLWNNIYKNLNLNLDNFLLNEKCLCNLEASQKAHVPVNYALSMFLLFDKEKALPMFKRILLNDKNQRLETFYQAEYFLIYERFFDRIKLDYIPKINPSPSPETIYFNNIDKKYITKNEIKLLIDSGDYFNKREFIVDPKILLTPRNILKKEILKESYVRFFKSIDIKFESKNIDILISCFTEINPGYDEFEIKHTRFILHSLLNVNKNHKNFIALNFYLLESFVLFESGNSLAFLFAEFFNDVYGMKPDNIKRIFYGSQGVNIDNSIPNSLKEYIDIHSQRPK